VTVEREPAGAPIAPIRGSPRGPSAGLALLLVAAAVTGAIVAAVLSGAEPAPAPSLAVVAPSPPVPTSTVPRSPRASPAPAPVPPAIPASPSTVLVIRGVTDPGATLGELAGCSPLLRVPGQPAPAIRGADVDATAQAAGRDTGWLFVPPGIQAVTRVWLGDGVIELARAAGRPVVAVGVDGEVWLGGASGAVRWQPIPTPAGRTAWVMTSEEVTGSGRCRPWDVPTAIADQRSLTCAGIAAPACLDLAAELTGEAPEVPYAGGGLALALLPCRPQTAACPEGQVAAAAVPPGWTGGYQDVRAAEAASGGRRFARLSPGALPDAAAAAIALASLPLPVEARAPRPASCAVTLEGDLRAAPWDPRVAWVGGTSVVWPAGSNIRFTAVSALTVPTADGTVRLVEGARARLRGTRDARTGAFVACGAGSVSVAAGG
jgi:hypothetical protein